jgi:uncharacterized membrane protein
MHNNLARIQVLYLIVLQLIFMILIMIGDRGSFLEIIRYVFAFINIALVPGYLILRIINIKELENAYIAFYTVGLSLCFLMVLGFLINFILPLLGINSPMTIWPMYFSYLMVICSLIIIYYLRNNNLPIEIHPNEKNILNRSILNYLLLALLPVYSIIGVLYLDKFGTNKILVTLFVIIALYVAIFYIAKKDKYVYNHNFNSFALYCISLALLLHYWLPTQYLVGFDVHGEYYFANLVNIKGYWSANLLGNYNSVLSTTILPIYFVKFMNIDLTIVFKLITPIFFASVPVVLYNLFCLEFDNRLAFLASFYFLSFYKYFTLSSFKEQIGQLFLVLFLITLFNKTIPAFKKTLLTIIFSISLIISHYALSFIMIFLLLFTFIYSKLVTKIEKDRHNKDTLLTDTFLIIFIVIAITWSIYISSSSGFNSIVAIANTIISTFMKDFLSMNTMDPLVITALGGSLNSIWRQTERIIFYITFLFIIIGVSRIVLYDRLFKKKTIAVNEISLENEGLAISCVIILGLCIIVPYFASYLNMDRFFQISLIILAPFCILGGSELINILFNKIKRIKTINSSEHYKYIVLFIIILFYLFNTGVVYEIVGNTPQLMLGKYRMEQSNDKNVQLVLYNSLINNEEYDGVSWLTMYKNMNQKIYASYLDAEYILESYGMLGPQESSQGLSIEQNIPNNSYVYLGSLAVKDGYIPEQSKNVLRTAVIYPVQDFKYILQLNDIYDNGGSEILLK